MLKRHENIVLIPLICHPSRRQAPAPRHGRASRPRFPAKGALVTGLAAEDARAPHPWRPASDEPAKRNAAGPRPCARQRGSSAARVNTFAERRRNGASSVTPNEGLNETKGNPKRPRSQGPFRQLPLAQTRDPGRGRSKRKTRPDMHRESRWVSVRQPDRAAGDARPSWLPTKAQSKPVLHHRRRLVVAVSAAKGLEHVLR